MSRCEFLKYVTLYIFPENPGRVIENIVAVEFKRRQSFDYNQDDDGEEGFKGENVRFIPL